ncbi:MAG: hypothetical protein EWM47_06825 [Anaerolineaceae bacterium]|nr:MAG: hypothetical protein EWM47_06825 [Anaerolineaceae bacterium]
MQSLRTKTTSAIEMEPEIIYNLIFKNALYSLECIRAGGNDKEDKNNYCFAENITEDEGEAEVFLQILTKGKVFPVHIKDLVEDYFN